MDRTSDQPQVNLSLLRSNSLRLYCKTIVRGIDYSHYTSRLFRVYKLMEAGWRGGGIWGELVTVYVSGYRYFQIYSQESTNKICPVHVVDYLRQIHTRNCMQVCLSSHHVLHM